MQTRIASLLEVGLHFKGAPCLRSLPRPASQNPNTPKPGAPVAWAGRGETEEQRLVGAAPLGNPLRHHPNRIIRHPELSPHCFLQEDHPCLSLPTYHLTGARGHRGTRATHPATQQPAGPRRASPHPSLAGEPDEPDPLPRAPGGLIGSFARAKPPGAGAGARRD